MDHNERAFYREILEAVGNYLCSYVCCYLLFLAVALAGAYLAFRYMDYAREKRLSAFEEYAREREKDIDNG